MSDRRDPLARRLVAIVAYVATVVAANWLTARYGLVPVAPGLLATAGTYAAGAAFVARDAVQDVTGRRWAILAVLVGAGLSWWLSTPALALASGAAFLASELADMAVYTPLRRRGYVRAAVASNAAGAVVDTLLFLTLADIPVTVLVVAGQLVGKAWVTALAVALVLIWRRRAVLRHGFDRAGA